MPDAAFLETTQTPEQVLSGLTLFLPPVRREDLKELRQVGDMLYTPSMLPRWGGEMKYAGAIDAGLSIRSGVQAARLCAHNLIALPPEELGSLDRVPPPMHPNALPPSTPP